MFKSHFKPTWCPTWPNLAPKTLQNGAPDPSLEQLFPLRWKTWKRTTVQWFCLFFHVSGDPLSPKNWCLDTTCHPTGSPSLFWTTLVMKMWKMGSQLDPQHGGNELSFSTLEPSWLHLGANLPPKWPQDPPRGHLGTILVPFWCHFGAILGPSWLEKCAHLASKFFSQVN